MASAMLNYFSQTGHDMYSAPFGDTVEGKARVWRWLAFLNADVHKAFGQLFRTPPGQKTRPSRTPCSRLPAPRLPAC